MNWANEALGAKLVDFSSELPGCEANNILHDDVSTLWLSEEGLPQWICISLENCGGKAEYINDVIIRTIGWYCWHSYSTNPKVVVIHVSKEGSKFKQWDTCVANSQADNTQRFCCAPINTSLYPYIALEVTATFGGLQTYMNNVFFYSDEVPASPAFEANVNNSYQYLNSTEHTDASQLSRQQQESSLEEENSSEKSYSIPAVVCSSTVEVSNVTLNEDLLLLGRSSVDTDILADQLSDALGLGGDDELDEYADSAADLVQQNEETLSHTSDDHRQRISSHSFSSISAVEPSTGDSYSSSSNGLFREQSNPKSSTVFVVAPQSSSVHNLLESLSCVQRTLDDLSTFTAGSARSRLSGDDTMEALDRSVFRHSDKSLVLFETTRSVVSDASSFATEGEALLRPDSLDAMEDTHSQQSEPSTAQDTSRHNEPPQLRQTGVADRLNQLEERFSRLLDLVESGAIVPPPQRPPPPPPLSSPSTEAVLQSVVADNTDLVTGVVNVSDGKDDVAEEARSISMLGENVIVQTAVTSNSNSEAPERPSQQLINEQQIEELVRKVLMQIAPNDRHTSADNLLATVTSTAVEVSTSSSSSSLRLFHSPVSPVVRSKECAAAMGDDRVRRRDSLLRQLRAEAGLRTEDVAAMESHFEDGQLTANGVNLSAAGDSFLEEVEGGILDQDELLLSAETDVLDRSVFELLEAKYHHRRSVAQEPSPVVLRPQAAESPPRHSPAVIASLPVIRRSIDREQQTDESRSIRPVVPVTHDACVGPSSIRSHHRRAREPVKTVSNHGSQTHSPHVVSAVDRDTIAHRRESSERPPSRTKVLTIEIKSEKRGSRPSQSDTSPSRQTVRPRVTSPPLSPLLLRVKVSDEMSVEDCELELLSRQLRAKILQRTLKAAQLQVLEARHLHASNSNNMRLV